MENEFHLTASHFGEGEFPELVQQRGASPQVVEGNRLARQVHAVAVANFDHKQELTACVFPDRVLVGSEKKAWECVIEPARIQALVEAITDAGAVVAIETLGQAGSIGLRSRNDVKCLFSAASGDMVLRCTGSVAGGFDRFLCAQV